jgi:hypothetical protein
MSNKNKRTGILNQVIDEQEELQEVVENETIVAEIEEVVEAEVPVIEEEIVRAPSFEEQPNREVVFEEPVIEEELVQEPVEEEFIASAVEAPKPARTIDSLSKSDLRLFQRTGVMPK